MNTCRNIFIVDESLFYSIVKFTTMQEFSKVEFLDNDKFYFDDFRLSLKSTVSSFFLRQFDKVKDQEYLTILLSLMSGILQTMYGTVYNTIKADIDNSTVVWIRGFLQVATMMCIGNVNQEHQDSVLKSPLMSHKIFFFL